MAIAVRLLMVLLLPGPSGERARRGAIAWYERLLRQFPRSKEGVANMWRLRLLRLGLDTGQRRYFCEYA